MLSYSFWALSWNLTWLLSCSANVFSSNSDTIPNANDQCKILLGEDASFCQNQASSMCASLYCRKSLTEPVCIYSGYDAAEGTPCFFGYVCQAGRCLPSSLAPANDCLYGDDIVTNNGLIKELLPVNAMSCTEAIIFLLQINKSPFTYCNDSNFRRTCCQTCKTLDAFTCDDSNPQLCSASANLCESLGSTINGIPIKLACQKTCNSCFQKQLKCSNKLCRNGASCVDVAGTLNVLIGFICRCPDGYFGNFCELKNPCSPNPCQNGANCVIKSATAYSCSCLPGFLGINCEHPMRILSSDLCSPNPCLNGGTCINSQTSQSYGCSCLYGYWGEKCQFVKNKCVKNPCLNGGTCRLIFSLSVAELADNYSCYCLPGYSGQNCEISSLDKCSINNGGCPSNSKCIFDPIVRNVTCLCSPLYTGKLCELFMNPCMDENGEKTCRNGGICLVEALKYPFYKCTCPIGHWGLRCQFNASPNTNYQLAQSLKLKQELITTRPTTTTTTRTQTTSTPLLVDFWPSCKDMDLAFCDWIKTNKFCDPALIINGVSVTKYCQLSCNSCLSIGDYLSGPKSSEKNGCFDANKRCSVWINHCYLLLNASPHPCRLSCGMC